MFLAPAFLFGLGLAGLPVAIHLFNRSRLRRVPWAAMEFLERAVSVRARRLKIEEILLLALRTLAVVFIVLALARPVVTGGGPAGEAIILLDVSASMRYGGGAGTLFDFAAARVREIYAALPPGSRVVLAAFDGKVEPAAGGAPVESQGALAAALKDVSPRWGPTDYASALAWAARVSPSFPSGAPAVFIVSDFRRGAADQAAAAGKVPGPLYLVPVAEGDGENVGITAVAPAGRAFTAAGTLLEARVANRTSAPRPVDIAFSVDERVSAGAHAQAGAMAEATATAVIDRLGEPGVHLVRARTAGDAYPGDDTYFAVVERRPLRIALRLGAGARRFVRRALEAAPDGSFDLREGPGAGGVDGFILAGEFPAGAEAEDVWRCVRGGAFAVIFYDGSAGAAGFLGASPDAGLAEIAEAGEAAGDFACVLAGEHPVTDFLRADSRVSVSDITEQRLARLPAEGGGAVTAAAIVAEGAGARYGFLVFARVGAGTAAIFNAAADRSGGDFVLSPLFVPLLFETISFAAGGAAEPAVCGRPAFLAAGAGAESVEVSGPSGPVSARLVSSPSGFGCTFTPMEPGFYRYGEAVIAANPAPAEGQTRAADFGELERAFGGEMLEAGGDFPEVLAAHVGGREISYMFLWSAVVMLAAEMALVSLLRHGR